MKQKILIKYHDHDFKLKSHGNWFDLYASENVELEAGDHKLIDLGVSMKLPKHYQANIVPRSSTFKKFNLIQANHYGVIDGPTNESTGYSGNNDRWKFSAIAFDPIKIKKGERLCQFEVRLSMNAPFWTKLKWLFSSGFKFIEVDDLKTEDRGGFGTTGK
ncbi:MAG: dUTP diphosphatase [bacterium]